MAAPEAPGTLGLEIRVTLLCGLVLVLEGYDIGAMAYTVPSLAQSWHLRPVAFTSALTAGSIGSLSALFSADGYGMTIGRKSVTVGCVAMFGITSLLTATAHGIPGLTAVRLAAGSWPGRRDPVCHHLALRISRRCADRVAW